VGRENGQRGEQTEKQGESTHCSSKVILQGRARLRRSD
jgi:hypothetical protein